MKEPRIEEARVEISRDVMESLDWNGSARVVARFSGADDFVQVLGFFHDEISFSPAEVIGLTQEELMKLFYEKDVRYLQS